MERYVGDWWLPARTEHRVSGELLLTDEEGGKLIIKGSFDESGDAPIEQDFHRVILGEAMGGERITLCQNLYIQSSRTGESTFTLTYKIYGEVYLGHWFNNLEEAVFKKVEIELNHLLEWTRWFSLNSNHPKEGDAEISITLAEEEPKRANTSFGTITINQRKVAKSDMMKHASLDQEASIIIDSKKQLNFRDFSALLLFPIQNLISLAAGEPCAIKKVQVWEIEETEFGGGPIEIWFSHHRRRSGAEDTLSPNLFLFSLPDISDKLGECFERWFKASQELISVFDLFFSVVMSPQMFGEHSFFNLATAAELYHSHRFSNEVLPPKKYEEKKGRILSAIDNVQDKQWLNQKLEFIGNRPSYRKRIEQLWDYHKIIMEPIVTTKNIFINRLVNSRNYYAHYDDSIIPAMGSELDLLTEQVSTLLKSCLLCELGLSQSEIAANFNKYVLYMRLKHIAESNRA